MAMTGRVTMRGIARWAGTGGSSRTIQRFFSTVIPWGILCWACCRRHVHCPGDISLGAGDAVIVPKAGKGTHGLDRFLARWSGKPVPGLAFFPLSRVRVQARRSFPMRVAQGVRTDEEQAASKAKAAAKQAQAPDTTRRPGRPQGSPNRPKAPVTLTPELGRITAMLPPWLHLRTTGLAVPSLGLDGHWGNHNARHMARPCGLHLRAKRRCAAALSCPYGGPYAGRGPRRH
jgi:putative transposase